MEAKTFEISDAMTFIPALAIMPTMKVAHNWIANEANWSELVSGQVIDVEFLTGKREAPKRSEAEIWK